MRIQELDRLRALTVRSEINENDTLEVMVFKAYLKHENIKDASNEINDLNYKDKNNNVIRTSPQEVSDIIKDKNTVIEDKELYDYVKSTFNSNKRKAIRRWG